MEDITIRGVLNRVNNLQEDFQLLRNNVSSFQLNNKNELNSLLTKSYECIETCKSLCDALKLHNSDIIRKSVGELSTIKQSLFSSLLSELSNIDKEYSDRSQTMYDTILSLIERLDSIHIDIINNDDNLTVTYTDHKGKIEYGTILKVRADNETIIQDVHGKLSLKLKLDDKSFIVKDDVIYPTELVTKSGQYVSSDYILNDLKNATFNISNIVSKLEKIQKLLSTSNGYMSSNNFKTSTPTLEKLTLFVIECLSTSNNQISRDLIPGGTKIKNTFDNHIWILNKTLVGGLLTYKWEDFGSDSICTANNDGIHGLVTGSNEKFEGHVSLQGTISINGLQEEIESIIESISSLGYTILNQEDRISVIELMLGIGK